MPRKINCNSFVQSFGEMRSVILGFSRRPEVSIVTKRYGFVTIRASDEVHGRWWTHSCACKAWTNYFDFRSYFFAVRSPNWRLLSRANCRPRTNQSGCRCINWPVAEVVRLLTSHYKISLSRSLTTSATGLITRPIRENVIPPDRIDYVNKTWDR